MRACRVQMLGLLALLLVIAIGTPGCERGVPQPAETDRDAGPLRVRVDVSDLSVRTVDEVHVTLTATVAPNWIVADQSDSFEAALAGAGWTVRTVRHPPPEVAPGGQLRLIWKGTVEPDLDGVYLIPPIRIDATPIGEGEPTTRATEPREVNVMSVLDDAEREELEDLATAFDTVSAELRTPELTEPSSLKGWVLTLIGVGIASVAAIALTLTALAVRGRVGDSRASTDAAIRKLRDAASGRTDDPIADASEGLLAVIGVVAGRDGLALSADDVRTALTAVVPASEARHAAGLVARLESARFNPATNRPSEPLAAEALALAERLLAEEGQRP